MSDIDDVKARLNIVEIVSERVALKKAGHNFKALCPFHAEKTPSFIVSPDRQTFHCFGCGRGGSIFDFVMLFEHVDFPEALETLAARAGVKLERRPADSPQAKLKQELYEVNHLASEYYHYLLTTHAVGEKARLYLKGRGISDTSIKTFTLGYSPKDWDGLLKFLKKKGYDEELLETAGLVMRTMNRAPRAKNLFYDRFRGRVMFTLKDHRGNVVGFAGRVLDPSSLRSLGQVRQEAKYINTSETPVYVKGNVLYGLDVTKDAIQKSGEAVVMEGEMDVISSFQAGIGNTVAIKGSALTEGHARLLRRFAERLTFALDVDPAGDAAARRGIEIAEAAGFDMRVVQLSAGKDPDEAAREGPGLLKKAIETAVPIYDYFITSATKRFDATTAFGKKKVSEELFPILSKIENPVVQGHYIRKLATSLAVSEDTVSDGVARVKVAPGVKPAEVSFQMPAGSRQEKLEVYLLAFILQGKTREFFDEFLEEGGADLISQPAVRRTLEELQPFLLTNSTFFIKDFTGTVPKELLPTIDEAFLWDIAEFLSAEELMVRQWNTALVEFQRVAIKSKIRQETSKLQTADDENASEVLQQTIRVLTEKLAKLEKTASL